MRTPEFFEKQAVEQLVSAELLYQDAAKLEVKDLDKKVEASFAQGKARFKDEQEFKNTIKDHFKKNIDTPFTQLESAYEE